MEIRVKVQSVSAMILIKVARVRAYGIVIDHTWKSSLTKTSEVKMFSGVEKYLNYWTKGQTTAKEKSKSFRTIYDFSAIGFKLH